MRRTQHRADITRLCSIRHAIAAEGSQASQDTIVLEWREIQGDGLDTQRQRRPGKTVENTPHLSVDSAFLTVATMPQENEDEGGHKQKSKNTNVKIVVPYNPGLYLI